jgi:hypothetical protein
MDISICLYSLFISEAETGKAGTKGAPTLARSKKMPGRSPKRNKMYIGRSRREADRSLREERRVFDSVVSRDTAEEAVRFFSHPGPALGRFFRQWASNDRSQR